VVGLVELRPGTAGQLTSCRVELFASPDSLAQPVIVSEAQPTSVPYRATFRFEDVPAGKYYLRAWQDRDLTSQISDGDYAGVYGGEFQRGWLGQPFLVGRGRVVDLGRVELTMFAELLIAAAGFRTQSRTSTDFSYSFNHDVVLTTLVVTFPQYGRYVAAGAAGPKRADTTYRSPGWSFGGIAMPTGTHRLEFRGQFLQDTFQIDVLVDVE